MTVASDNKFPKLILEETANDGSDITSPAADHRALILGEDGILRLKDSAGTVSPYVGLNKWDGTTAPTANEDSGDGYAVGSRWIDTTNNKEYVCLDATATAAVWTETTQSGGGGIDSGTAFPGSPSDGDLFHRTDLDEIYRYVNASTHWRCTSPHEMSLGVGDAVLPYAWAASSISIGRAPVPHLNGNSDLWLVGATFTSFQLATLDVSNFATLTVNKRTAANDATALASRANSGDTASNWTRAEVAIGAALGGVATYKELDFSMTKTGTPGNTYASATLLYRHIG